MDGRCWKWLKSGGGGAILPAGGCHMKGGGLSPLRSARKPTRRFWLVPLAEEEAKRRKTYRGRKKQQRREGGTVAARRNDKKTGNIIHRTEAAARRTTPAEACCCSTLERGGRRREQGMWLERLDTSNGVSVSGRDFARVGFLFPNASAAMYTCMYPISKSNNFILSPLVPLDCMILQIRP